MAGVCISILRAACEISAREQEEPGQGQGTLDAPSSLHPAPLDWQGASQLISMGTGASSHAMHCPSGALCPEGKKGNPRK